MSMFTNGVAVGDLGAKIAPTLPRGSAGSVSRCASRLPLRPHRRHPEALAYHLRRASPSRWYAIGWILCISVALAASLLFFWEIAYRVAVARRARGRRRRALGLANVSGVAEVLGT